MTTSLRIAVISILSIFSLGAIHAAEVLELGSGLSPGDKLTANERAEGLDISAEVRSSTMPGKVRVIVTFCHTGSSTWVGGIRVSDSPPRDSLSTLRVPAGDCRTYAETLSPTSLYVYVRRDNRQ